MRPAMTRKRYFGASKALLIATVLLTATSGCASVKPTKTGYLSDYSRIECPDLSFHWGFGYHSYALREPTPAELVGIDSFYIEPVAWLCPEDDWLGHDKTRQERVTAALDESLRYRFGKIRPIVAAPGPNTARVHAAVTDVSSARNITNALASIVFGPISNGGASVEAEVIRPDGIQIAAIRGASRGGGLDFYGYYVRSGHAKKSVRRLTRNLADGVAEAADPSDSVTR